jgi:hypothetical protein
MVEKTEWYIFILAAILIGVVYYVGVRTDIGTFSSAFNSFLNVITGRPAAGGAFQSVNQVVH